MQAGDDGAVTPVDHALDQLRVAVEHLTKVVDDGGLDLCDDSRLLAVMLDVEEVRNRLPVVDHQLINNAAARRLPETLTQGTMVRLLTTTLRLSPGEAARRVRAADALGYRRTTQGDPLEPRRPVLAAAQRDGSVTPEQVAIVERALARVDHRGFDPHDLDAGEQLLTAHAIQFGPPDLRLLADKVVDAIDPDGTRPNDELNADRRHLHLRPTKDGAWTGELRLTGALGAKLHALLDPLVRPRIDNLTGGPGSGEGGEDRPDQEVGIATGLGRHLDTRTPGQRTHDALEELCDRLLRAGDPGDNGIPATVIITVNAENLLAGRGQGTTSDGTALSIAEIRRIADQAEIYLALTNRHGVVLDLQRTRRLASRGQTAALIARDGGCSFPGCSNAPEWCERHHIREWVHGGLTNLDNLTLLCRYHHHNFASRGWTCTMNLDGLPEWRPPRWLDRRQRPLVNHRIAAGIEGRRFQDRS